MLAYTIVNNGRPRDEHLRDCDVGKQGWFQSCRMKRGDADVADGDKMDRPLASVPRNASGSVSGAGQNVLRPHPDIGTAQQIGDRRVLILGHITALAGERRWV